MNDKTIEQEIQAKGLTAPRVTPDDLAANIVSEHYFTAADGYAGASGGRPTGGVSGNALGLLTFCVLVLRNGFTVTGESACASAENFDAELGRKIARDNAINKVWPLMGYALKERLHATPIAESEPTGEIKVGTLVRLKSGGPVMTAGTVRANGNVECQWRTEHGNPTYEVGEFPIECLTIQAKKAA